MTKLKDILYHRKNERRGLWVFLLIMTLGLIGRYVFLTWYTPEKQDYSDLLSDVEFVDAKPKKTRKKYRKYKTKSSYTKKLKLEIKRFTFDPNTISQDSLVLLGVPKYIASNLEKYRAKGGRFRKSEDFRRIYGMDKYYDNLADFIKIKSTGMSVKATEKQNSKKEKAIDSNYLATKPQKKLYPQKQRVIVELNGANPDELEKLYGVGPFYAKMITEYREKLGGYHSPEQITEAYKIPDTILTTIGREWIQVDTDKIQKIDLNKADFKTLVRHPYLNKNQTNAILKYRKVHGNYSSISDVKKIVIIKDADFIRLQPYLMISEK